MERQKITHGEPVDAGSPFTSEEDAIKNASFGMYTYDTSSRSNQMNQVQLPGWQGVSTSMNPNGFYTMNPPVYNPYVVGQPVGLGANPYMHNTPYYQQPQYYNPYQPNPAFGYMNAGIGMYTPPQQQQNLVLHIPAVNMGGEFLPPMDFQEKIDKLQQEYWIKEIEESAKSKQNMSNSYGMNYYGMPYYNNYYSYNSLRSEVDSICRQMMDEARENRRQLNIHLSKLAYSYLGKDYDESEIEAMHTGRDIENPGGMTLPFLFNQNKLSNLVPFDNSAQYRNHDLAVSAEHAKYVDPDSNMIDCFNNIGLLGIQYSLEEEQHRRRDCSSLYDSSDSGYRYFVKKKALERLQNKDNGSGNIKAFNSYPSPQIDLGRTMLNSFSTLSNAASLTDDGTLNITCNFGSKAGQVYSVNQNEAKYQQDRERFNRFLDSIPVNIAGVKT